MIKFWSKFHIQILWYSFTRDTMFLLMLSQSLPENRKTLPPAPLDISATTLVCIFSSILNTVMEGWKYRSRELLKTIFCRQKTRKQTDSTWDSLQPSLQVCSGAYFLLLHLFRGMSQPSGQDLPDVKQTYSGLPS